jgi:hypothetical protein
MRVLVFGQRHWGACLARQLNRYGGSWSVVAEYFNVAAPNFHLPRVAVVKRADVIIRVGYPVGAPTIRGRAFDFFWRALHVTNPLALYVHYWIGTDVQSVTRYHDAGTLRSGVFQDALDEMHATSTPWLVDELSRLSIKAVNMPAFGPDLPAVEDAELSLPQQFTVLTYIPDQRSAFYGGEQVVRIAQLLPQVRFLVVSGTGRWLRDRPANIAFLGWRDDMAELYKNSTVVLRLAEHDAVGGTVEEGLAMARHVIYNYPAPFTTTVGFADVDGVVEVIRRLQASNDAGRLSLNMDGRRWVLSVVDQAHLTGNICEALTKRMGESHGKKTKWHRH